MNMTVLTIYFSILRLLTPEIRTSDKKQIERGEGERNIREWREQTTDIHFNLRYI